jgi:hypothetical protein
MNEFKEIVDYLDNWEQFQKRCLDKCKKFECQLSTKNWEKLREWHLENYIHKLNNPIGFFINVKNKHFRLYMSIKSMRRIHATLVKIEEECQRLLSVFPTEDLMKKYRNML